MSKRVLMHAGPGKTGTSAVQRWLTRHSPQLEELGVHYPRHPIDPNGVSSGNLRHVMVRRGPGRYEVAPGKVARALEALRLGDFHTLLLSAEYFFRIIPELHRAIPDGEFLLYVRDPVERAESSYNQGVKRAGTHKPFPLGRARKTPALDLISDLLAESRPPRILLRPYGRPLFHGGNIVDDFLHGCGIENATELAASSRGDEIVNPGYSLEALEFKRHLNHFPLLGAQTRVDRVLQDYQGEIIKYSFIPEAVRRKLTQKAIARVEAFMAEHGRPELEPLVGYMADKPLHPHYPQEVSRDQLQAVSEHIATRDAVLWDEIARTVRAFRGIALPNAHFYDVFGATSATRAIADDRSLAMEIAKDESSRSERSSEEVLLEMMAFFDKRDEPDAVRVCGEALATLRPPRRIDRLMRWLAGR